ncbi:nucleolus protein [Pelomyxa schiedti]|nr:nucleolus protein [Pelomyxa schiedti]
MGKRRGGLVVKRTSVHRSIVSRSRDHRSPSPAQPSSTTTTTTAAAPAKTAGERVNKFHVQLKEMQRVRTQRGGTDHNKTKTKAKPQDAKEPDGEGDGDGEESNHDLQPNVSDKGTSISEYQDASETGASDFSTHKWVIFCLKKLKIVCDGESPTGSKLKLLDVGSISNSFRKYQYLDVTAIDLNPRNPFVLEANFLDVVQDSSYDIISLCLVMNFEPNPRKRGEMLKVAFGCLKEGGLLFLVLPKACFENSRYMTYGHFAGIAASIGFSIVYQKQSAKLAFHILKRDTASHPPTGALFPRRLIRGGKQRNNFTIILAPKSDPSSSKTKAPSTSPSSSYKKKKSAAASTDGDLKHKKNQQLKKRKKWKKQNGTDDMSDDGDGDEVDYSQGGDDDGDDDGGADFTPVKSFHSKGGKGGKKKSAGNNTKKNKPFKKH